MNAKLATMNLRRKLAYNAEGSRRWMQSNWRYHANKSMFHWEAV